MKAFLPRWSPDARKIAFAATLPRRRSHVYVVSAEGGRPEQVTHGEGNEGDVDWSPDGTSLVFGSLGCRTTTVNQPSSAINSDPGFDKPPAFDPSRVGGSLLPSVVARRTLFSGHAGRTKQAGAIRFQNEEMGGTASYQSRFPKLVPGWEIHLL
jgi:dipeptidyl aminopeptidase/acylaminoacyl peptidase